MYKWKELSIIIINNKILFENNKYYSQILKNIPLSSNSKGNYFYPIGNHRNEHLNNDDIIIISACSAGDLGSSPGSGRSSGEGNGYPFPSPMQESEK